MCQKVKSVLIICIQVLQQPRLLEKEGWGWGTNHVKADKQTDKPKTKLTKMKKQTNNTLQECKTVLTARHWTLYFPKNNQTTQKVKIDLVCTTPPPPQLLWEGNHCARCCCHVSEWAAIHCCHYFCFNPLLFVLIHLQDDRRSASFHGGSKSQPRKTSMLKVAQIYFVNKQKKKLSNIVVFDIWQAKAFSRLLPYCPSHSL